MALLALGRDRAGPRVFGHPDACVALQHVSPTGTMNGASPLPELHGPTSFKRGDAASTASEIMSATTWVGNRDRGGSKNVPNARGGGELAPKVAPRRLGLLTPKMAIFYRISVERGQLQGPLKIQNFHPHSNFRRFDPPYPGLQKGVRLRLGQCQVAPLLRAARLQISFYFQRAAKGGRQQGVGHSQFLFSHFLVTSLSFSVTFWKPFSRFWLPFCLSPFAYPLCGTVIFCGSEIIPPNSRQISLPKTKACFRGRN